MGGASAAHRNVYGDAHCMALGIARSHSFVGIAVSLHSSHTDGESRSSFRSRCSRNPLPVGLVGSKVSNVSTLSPALITVGPVVTTKAGSINPSTPSPIPSDDAGPTPPAALTRSAFLQIVWIVRRRPCSAVPKCPKED